jgi:hypothetical protein
VINFEFVFDAQARRPQVNAGFQLLTLVHSSVLLVLEVIFQGLLIEIYDRTREVEIYFVLYATKVSTVTHPQIGRRDHKKQSL